MTVDEVENRLKAVNAALQEFAPDTWVEKGDRGWIVSWKRGKKVVSRRWCTLRGNDHYPAWFHKWAHGGTCCMALAQLMRWLQGRPVLPLGTWRYWSGDLVKLGSPKLTEILQEAGYPEKVTCVVCGENILGGLDWWRLDKVSGPCHTFGVCKNRRMAA